MNHAPEVIERVLEMRGSGEFYRDIATALGLKGKNAIAGIVSRHGRHLPRPVRPKAEPPVEKPARRRKPPSVARPTVVRTINPVTEIRPNPIHVFEAKGCRWALWSNETLLSDKNYCSAACREGQTFCEGHRRIAYRPKERRAS